jgi:drug/metabolite transporter (DMT)-like permease
MKLNSSERRGLLYVVLAVVMFATSPVLIRLANPVSSFEITFLRMALAALTVLALSRALRQPIHLQRSDLGRFALYGLVAALHFLLYIASLSFTTIAHSLSLVYTAPIFIAILSAAFLGEHIPRRKYGGIAVAVLGLRMLFGDVLALGSAVCFGFYSVFGRSQRDRYPLLTYAFAVYGMAALWLVPVAAMSFKPVYTPVAVVGILFLGVFPLGLGHTLYNAALRRVHASYANLIATQEVTGGILLGFLVLGEVPGANAIIGCLMTLGGILLVLL